MNKRTIFFLLVSLTGLGQITLEHTYDGSLIDDNRSDFVSVKVGPGDSKYIYTTKSNGFRIYNSDHTLYDTGHFPVSTTNFSVSHFTTSLFDCDSTTMEYLFYSVDIVGSYFVNQNVSIYRTDGTLLFSRDSANGSRVLFSHGVITDNVYQTSTGARMVLPMSNGDIEIYELCGNVPSNYLSSGNPTENATAEFGSLKVFPNPASNFSTVEFQLPENNRSGEVIVMSQEGKQVRRIPVNEFEGQQTFSTLNLESGVYFYYLKTSSTITPSVKQIIIN